MAAKVKAGIQVYIRVLRKTRWSKKRTFRFVLAREFLKPNKVQLGKNQLVKSKEELPTAIWLTNKEHRAVMFAFEDTRTWDQRLTHLQKLHANRWFDLNGQLWFLCVVCC